MFIFHCLTLQHLVPRKELHCGCEAVSARTRHVMSLDMNMCKLIPEDAGGNSVYMHTEHSTNINRVGISKVKPNIN